MAEMKSRMRCIIGESMLFREIESTRRQGFDSFVFSHVSVEDRSKTLRPRDIVRVGRVYSRLRTSYSLAGNVSMSEYPSVPARPGEYRYNNAARISSENGIIDKLLERLEVVFSAGEVATGIARNQLHRVQGRYHRG